LLVNLSDVLTANVPVTITITSSTPRVFYRIKAQ
jgi:hypothetical protein